MIKRLAVVGAVLVIAGPLNLTGYGTVTTAVGAAALLGAAVWWAFTHRRKPRTGEPDGKR